MSVVANVVTENAAWVAYDGRAIQNGVIISENTVKARKINENVCIGYTGTLELAEAVVSILKKAPDLRKAYSDQVARGILAIMYANGYPQDMIAQFIITGINGTGNMITYTIGTDKTLSILQPSEREPIKSAVLSTGKHGIDLEPYLLHEISASGFTGHSIRCGLKEFILEVSRKDQSVNNNVNFIAVHKGVGSKHL